LEVNVAELIAASLIRDVENFPNPGIIFKDITPILSNPAAYQEVIDYLLESTEKRPPDVVAAVESRGFMFGAPVALCLSVPFVPIRKTGKLPYSTIREEYQLEYGQDAVEMHTDAIKPGQKVLIIDDVLATGGTAGASARLVEKAGGIVTGVSFVIELTFLAGRAALGTYEVHSLVKIP
jgi:adenine phosphoribosyltransferase